MTRNKKSTKPPKKAIPEIDSIKFTQEQKRRLYTIQMLGSTPQKRRELHNAMPRKTPKPSPVNRSQPPMEQTLALLRGPK